ncbi:hypothetical protein FC80_GL000855 [Liquorilactobacillus cacaonum DSM 21116]|uniref:Uncharacterized protein n=1 Tax=Liquorilactobacillus cacaonum DSM 21116 TaxID=1423729 RepID=A0A0R2CGM7_9LACO|nr:hypothetical protein FC80_GL000855 [Liquorilactobacillus cacaonum DSM 21116]
MYFHPEKHKDLQIILRVVGIILLILSFLTFTTIFFKSPIYLSLIIIFDVVIIPIFPILSLSYIEN